MKNIYLITGGQRSGKSLYAEHLAMSLTEEPVYLATAHISDAEMEKRVAKHRQRRGDIWTTIEEETNLSRHDMTGKVVLVDCLTTWIANMMMKEAGAAHDASLPNGAEATADLQQSLYDELDRLFAQDATFIFVTNEVGMGGISANTMQRQFSDLQGMVNQYVAHHADNVVLMVSGLPVIVK